MTKSEASDSFFDLNSWDTEGNREALSVDEVSVVESMNKQQLSLAVTSGPGQSESSGFSLGTTDGLVDKFTGDFTYSIPLMDVEGYPIVINYNSNIGMNTDACLLYTSPSPRDDR